MIPRVIFFSADAIAIPCLSCLKADPRVSLAGVVTQPERAKGRGQKISLNPIAQWAYEQELPFVSVDVMDDATLGAIQSLKPDLAYVMAFGHILKPNVLEIPPLGMWNFHTSLLPRYRGASPMQTCLLNGDLETGITLMRMVKEMDAGPILAQKFCRIDPQETTGSLSQKLSKLSSLLLQETLPLILSGHPVVKDQDPAQVSFCKKFCKSDGALDFNQSAEVLERKIRAFQPWPSAYFFKDNERYIVRQAHVEAGMDPQPGQFLLNAEHTQLYITTQQGRLAVDVLQKSGGKPLPIAAFLRGNNDFDAK